MGLRPVRGQPRGPHRAHSIKLDEEGATAPQPGTSSNATVVLTAVVSIEQGGKIWVGCSEYARRKGDSATARIISIQLSSFTTETQTGVDNAGTTPVRANPYVCVRTTGAYPSPVWPRRTKPRHDVTPIE